MKRVPNALHNAPVTDENFLLTDPAQLRAIIRGLADQLETLYQDPYTFVRNPAAAKAVHIQYLALHASTCENCAAGRKEEGIEATDFHRNALTALLKALALTDDGAEIDELERKVDILEAAILSGDISRIKSALN